MHSGQKRQLNLAINPIHELIAELAPTIIEPSREKRKALGVADYTMLFRIGVTRIITMYPIEANHWNLKHFRSDAGTLTLLRGEDVFTADADIPKRALAEAIIAVDEQIAEYRTGGIPDPDHDRINTALVRLAPVLRNRQVPGSAPIEGDEPGAAKPVETVTPVETVKPVETVTPVETAPPVEAATPVATVDTDEPAEHAEHAKS